MTTRALPARTRAQHFWQARRKSASFPRDSMLLQVLVRGWDRLIHLAARIAYLAPITRPERYGVDLERDVPYVDDGQHAHLLDIYKPRHRASRGTVLYVHGGGFAVLSKDTHRVMAMAFALRGYTVFNINYRLGPTNRYPAPLEDAAAALAWVADNARRYGADPERLVLAG